MKVWVYQGRHGQLELYPEGDFERARAQQDEDNRCTLDDIRTMGLDVSGSEAEGSFSIDEGGRIDLVEVQ